MFNRYYPLIRFLGFALILYIVWYGFYDLLILPDGRLDLLVTHNMVFLSGEFLQFFGYEVISINRSIAIGSAEPLWIGNPCNGIPLFAIFTGFIIAYPGNILNKIIFIPLGIITIHLLNTIRVISLTLVQYYAPEYLNFNHNYTFTIIVYGYIFILWMIWANKFGAKLISPNISKPGSKT